MRKFLTVCVVLLLMLAVGAVFSAPVDADAGTNGSMLSLLDLCGGKAMPLTVFVAAALILIRNRIH